MKCIECNFKKEAESRPSRSVPGHAFEVAAAEFHYITRRLVAIIILLVVLLVGSNVAWIIYESQMEQVTEYTVEAEQEAEGGNNYAVNGDFNG